ncbi:PREDICTED: probable serine hydrolase [Rhagoletis zephyria]|uniref:probable serine hydrolase n=1 Tax=Rhagoletis zephyria TaxID=28612 RepID=UPI00081133E7|nr:PREDICTED: probable serine hydrolase [Rhagoletis zephyria]
MTHEKKLEFTEITIPVPWGHISGRWYGDHTVRPLLALHGWLDNCGSFAKLAPLLIQTIGSVLCIDLPGHGYSTHLPPGTVYHSLEYVRAVLRLMKVYNWPKISLLGHSMGGAVVFFFAALYPTKVDVLIGIDAIKRPVLKPQDKIEYFRHAMGKALQDNQRLVDDTSQQEPPNYTFAECEQLLHKGSGYSVDLENCKYILERNLSRSQKYPERYYFSRDTRLKYITALDGDHALFEAMAMRISEAAVPYVVIKAGASNYMDDESMQLIRLLEKHNPNFETHVIANGKHHVHLNEAPVVAELIASFLKRHRPLTVVRAEQPGVENKNETVAKGKL